MYYRGLHRALDDLYSDIDITFKESDESKYSKSVFDDLMKYLHKQGFFNTSMMSSKQVRAAINETYRILNTAVDKGLSTVNYKVPQDMKGFLQANVFNFSGFKTYNELVEASSLLTDENGAPKPWEAFKNDVLKIHEQYNVNYLRAEYEFAQQAAISAASWKRFEAAADRYNLQYRTAGDEKVRETHVKLDGLTLEITDTFWDEYYPPNGWGCRCRVIQVLKRKYPLSDHDKAMKLGEEATTQLDKNGNNKGAIFRFNPGKEMKIFPDKHPYFPKNCGDCSFNNPYNAKANQNCTACRLIYKDYLKQQEKELKEWSKLNIEERKGLSIQSSSIESGSILVLRKSIKNVIGHTTNIDIRNSLYSIKEITKNFEYIGWSPVAPETHSEADFFVYYKLNINNKTYYVNIMAHNSFKREVLYCIKDIMDFDKLTTGTPPNIDNYKKK